MKIINSKFLFFVGLIILSTVSYGQKKIDDPKEGKLTLAFGYKSGDKVQTIFPLNGGSINKDSLKIADQLIFVYKIKEKSYLVKNANYVINFAAPGRDVFEYQLFGFDIFKNHQPDLISNEKIIIYVKYIILNANDTIFTPSPVKSGVYRMSYPGNFMMPRQPDLYGDSAYYRKEGGSIIFEAPAFEFIVK